MPGLGVRFQKMLAHMELMGKRSRHIILWSAYPIKMCYASNMPLLPSRSESYMDTSCRFIMARTDFIAIDHILLHKGIRTWGHWRHRFVPDQTRSWMSDDWFTNLHLRKGGPSRDTNVHDHGAYFQSTCNGLSGIRNNPANHAKRIYPIKLGKQHAGSPVTGRDFVRWSVLPSKRWRAVFCAWCSADHHETDVPPWLRLVDVTFAWHTPQVGSWVAGFIRKLAGSERPFEIGNPEKWAERDCKSMLAASGFEMLKRIDLLDFESTLTMKRLGGFWCRCTTSRRTWESERFIVTASVGKPTWQGNTILLNVDEMPKFSKAAPR